MDIRVGLGTDIHRIVSGPGRPFILGGVRIPCNVGLIGHSDADALLHAIMDSFLGAAGYGDIGTFFPDTDPKWQGANSLDLMARAWGEVKRDGWRVVNIDCSIVLQRPKLAGHIAEMKRNISQVLGVDEKAVGIKATTSEGLGYVGREEGIFVQAVTLLSR